MSLLGDATSVAKEPVPPHERVPNHDGGDRARTWRGRIARSLCHFEELLLLLLILGQNRIEIGIFSIAVIFSRSFALLLFGLCGLLLLLLRHTSLLIGFLLLCVFRHRTFKFAPGKQICTFDSSRVLY